VTKRAVRGDRAAEGVRVRVMEAEIAGHDCDWLYEDFDVNDDVDCAIIEMIAGELARG
jgi:hypothetical protein